jgi:hypothetical protein
MKGSASIGKADNWLSEAPECEYNFRRLDVEIGAKDQPQYRVCGNEAMAIRVSSETYGSPAFIC